MTMEDSGPAWVAEGGSDLVARPAHRDWLRTEAIRLLEMFQKGTIDPKGGFRSLDAAGAPVVVLRPGGSLRYLHETTRMVHCYAAGILLGLPGASRMVDHGMAALSDRHLDRRHGGWVWSFDDDGPVNDTKQAYGHAFVLLAAASAKMVGHPAADALIADATGIIERRFWDQAFGVSAEEFTADWQPLGDYRGQNSNMHLTEALMAAHEATGEASYLAMAERIAAMIIDRQARAEGWRVPEHYGADWQVDRDYEGDPMFRPAGTTPGHALEWSRLLVQLWSLGQRRNAWMLDAAQALFMRTCAIGWDRSRGGFYYTLDWQDRPARSDRYWWPCAEAIGAAAVLRRSGGDARFETWYRRIWDFTARHLIDPANGGWFPELDDDLNPVSRVFVGKPDLYHALQACLIPLLPSDRGIVAGLLAAAGGAGERAGGPA